jgi:hypothetical protein
MKKDDAADDKPKITLAELKGLLTRIENKQITKEDYEKIGRVLDCYLQLVSALRPSKNLSFSRFKKIFHSFFE